MDKFIRLALFAILAAAAQLAGAQAWPTKPIKLVATFPPGGGSDMIARTLAPKLSEVLSTPVIVENRAGASGGVGTDYVAKSEPDGYTLLLCHTGPLLINPALYSDIKYSAQNFAPISMIVSTPTVLVVNPSVPAKTIGELVRIAKANPRSLNFASSGQGGTSHLAGEMLKLLAGIDMKHVPYKGAGPAVTDVLAGRVEMVFLDVSIVIGHVKSGKLRAVAWAGDKRGEAFPDIPTIAESGYPGYDITAWQGILAPAGTPKPVIDKLNAAVVKVMQVPEVRGRFEAAFATPLTSTPEEFGAYILAEQKKWGDLAKRVNLKIE